MRKFTPFLAPAALVIIGIILFLPPPEVSRPPISFRPDPPEASQVPHQGEPAAPIEPQRLLPPDKPPVPPWEMPREPTPDEIKAARQAENERVVFVRRGGKRYHNEKCQFAKDAIAVKKFDAMAHDYSPCSICGG